MTFLNFWLPILAFVIGVVLDIIIYVLLFKWFFIPILRGYDNE